MTPDAIRMTLLTLVTTALAASAPACGTARVSTPKLDDTSYPWTLLPVTRWPRNVMLNQRVEARARGAEHGFDAVLQKRGDSLTLLGLTPFGTRAFVLEQRGVEVSFRSFVDRDLPFPPRFMLIDIQRTFFALDPSERPPEDGRREFTFEGERVVEEWAGGVLRRRDFERLDGLPKGRITIDYDAWREGAPMKVTISNGWFGYVMEVTTREVTVL